MMVMVMVNMVILPSIMKAKMNCNSYGCNDCIMVIVMVASDLIQSIEFVLMRMLSMKWKRQEKGEEETWVRFPLLPLILYFPGRIIPVT